MQSLSCENEFYLHENKSHFHINGFAFSLALKQKLGATWKWLIKKLVCAVGDRKKEKARVSLNVFLLPIVHYALSFPLSPQSLTQSLLALLRH